jgi:hypothetical protein
MECRVFYSWQTDLPNTTNRGFIQSALESAANSIRDDESIKIEPVIDRDTAGVPGAPDIADTILAKIEKSQIFVADVSIINKTEKSRKIPNPNVLVELGYAMKTLGLDRIIMVMNTTFGKPELLPFDLRMRRVITYEMPENEQNRSVERKKLSAMFERGIRSILNEIDQEETTITPTISILEQAITAVGTFQKNQTFLVREYMKSLYNSLLEIAPNFPGTQETDEPDDILIQSIENSFNIIADFARLAETIAVLDAQDAAISLCKSFSQILDRYNYTPPNFSGSFYETQQQFFRFIGHELFTIFMSFFINENRWEIIVNILEEGIFVTRSRTGNPDSVSFENLSQHVSLLYSRKQRLKSNRISIHADLLNDRHTTGKLGEICPIEQFIAADFFLFLRKDSGWRPWSTLYMFQHLPKFLLEAKREKYAKQLLRPLNVNDVDALRMLVSEANARLHQFYNTGFWDSSLDSFNLMTIGSN